MSWFCDAHRAEHEVCDHRDLNQPPHAHCAFDIWAPDRHSSINNLAFSAYAFHQQQIEDFIDALAATSDPNDYSNQCAAAQCAGLDLDTLTPDEIEYIEKETAKRYSF